ncbi:toprim domain-containing protein [Cardinium endosymbiont of Dermatophagoides farinae]|uniref:toprim domain-containing protein n=1 Tax=Cardinium endosymbiont of Dermatophagoides farinae TaxID=2597823 RepID=UPI0011822A2C|nr:toprim domain-containing protein [Cardinium endosymbiont of Dermatophagoides farinae]TSJ79781.1 toprim domain-containing protein [Cardinium endosymbiont of Dermatophagoides farinae]
MKREVNLIQHAVSMGYILDREKSSKTWAVMEKEGDKILIKNSPNQNDHWMYKSLIDEQEKGTIVDFMQKRGFSYQSICRSSSRHLDDRVVKDQKSLSVELGDVFSQRHIAQEAFNNRVVEHQKGNYLACRGIDAVTYGCYIGVKVGNQAVFALYRDIDSNGKGTICSTISYQSDAKVSMSDDGFFNSTKYFQKGLPLGLSVLVESGLPVKHIVVSESPIDALSYKQIHKPSEGTMYVATCGSLSEGVKKELANVFSNAMENGWSVTLAFDSDKAGRCMDKEVRELADTCRVRCKLSIPF